MHSITEFFHNVITFIQPFAERMGAPGLILVAFLDCSFLSLPNVGDALIVLLTIEHPDRWWLYSGATTIGSTLGCLVLYFIARKGGEAFLSKRFSASQMERGLGLFRRHGLLAVVVPAFLPPPTPFKLFVLLAGLAGIEPAPFSLGIAIGRGFRFGLEGWLAYRYGSQATDYIKSNLATVSAAVAGVVLLVGLVIIVMRARKRRGGAA